MPGEPPFRTLTVPRCSMAETLRVRLDTTPAGREITKRLTATPQGGETRMLYGPDMQPMAAAVCLVARLEARCKPEFVRLLNTFALETTLPEAA